MKKILRHTLYLFVLTLLFALPATAQTFKASVEDLGGQYRVVFTVTDNDAEDFTPPSLADFDVLSGPYTSSMSSYQFINGKASHTSSKTYTYILAPRRAGNLTIGAASVRVGGKTLRTRPVSVKSSGASTANQGGNTQGGGAAQGRAAQPEPQLQEAGASVSQRDLFIDVTPSRTKVREQEAVLLTYRVHARSGVGLSQTSLTQKPDFKGLISQEIPLAVNQIEMHNETRGGVLYKAGTILQYVVFPQQSGRITIPSITFSTTVVQQQRDIDLIDAFFNGGGMVGVEVRRTVKPITLDVSKLPEPKPANFSGAVGKFMMKGAVQTPNVRTNDVATYRITLNGLGNLKLITPPNVSFPKDFETFDPKTSDNTKVTAQGLHGELTFDYTFVPRNVGQYTIPATEFVFFNTETGEYQTLHTEPVTLDIKKGTKSTSDVDRQLALLNSDIRAARTPEQPTLLAWGSGAYILVYLLVALVGVVALVVAGKYSAASLNLTERRKRGAGRAAERRLRDAKKWLAGSDTAPFYDEVTAALTRFVSDTFNVGQGELGEDRIRALFAERGVDEALTQRFVSLIEECRFAQYAPGAGENRQTIYDEASALINELQSALKK